MVIKKPYTPLSYIIMILDFFLIKSQKMPEKLSGLAYSFKKLDSSLIFFKNTQN